MTLLKRKERWNRAYCSYVPGKLNAQLLPFRLEAKLRAKGGEGAGYTLLHKEGATTLTAQGLYINIFHSE